MKRLLLLLTFLLALPSAAQKSTRLPDHIKRSQLDKIIKEAGTWGLLPKELKTLHLFPAATAANLTIFEGREKTTTPVNIQSRVGYGEYLIISLHDEKGELISHDVLRFHYATQLYHRWQIFADEKKPTRILIGHPLHVMSLKQQREQARSPRNMFTNISWREAGAQFTKEPAPSIMMRESVALFPNSPKRYTTHLVITKNDQVMRREFLDLTPPEEAAPLAEADKKPDESKAGKLYTFPEFNCSFTHPDGEFRVIDHSQVNPDACLMISQLNPRSGLTIIAENAGAGLINSKQLNAIVIPRFQGLFKNHQTSEPRTVTVNGIDFILTTVLGEIGSKQVSYTFLISEHNGFAYQLLSYQREKEFAPSQKTALALAQNFKLIDPARKADGLLIASDPYENPAMGITFDPRKVDGREWSENELWQDYPAASYGCQLSTNSGLIIVPVDLRDLEPTDTALASSLMQHIGLNFENQITRTTPHSQGSAQGHQYESVVRSQGDVTTYRIRVLRNGSTACLLCALGLNSTPANTEKLVEMLDQVQFTLPPAPDIREKTSPNRKRDADIVNSIGLNLYLKGKYSEASPYFHRAAEISPDDASYAGNIINALRHSGKPTAALELFQATSQKLPKNQAIAALEPHILINLDRKDEAVDSFAKLYENNCRDEGDLLTFLNLLSELNRLPEAIKIINRFVETDPAKSFRPLRWQHQIYAQNGQFEKALAMARKLDTDNPGNGQARNDLILTLIEASKADEALTLLDQELEKTPNDSYILYQKGRAHQSTKNYQKAKESYEAALAASPDEPTISQALANVSAFLGQGDQSAIRTEIPIVAIPADLRKQLDQHATDLKDTGFNLKQLKSITGHHFKKDKRFRTTETREYLIFNQAGVEELKTLRFSFDPTYERAYINRVEITKGEKKTVLKGKEIESYVSDTSAQDGAMATTSSTVTATIPGLSPGCRVRVEHTVQTLATLDEFPFQLKFFARASPAGPRAIFVDGDIEKISDGGNFGDLQETRSATHRSWLRPVPPLYHNEALLPRYEDYLPYLALGEGSRSWSEVVKGYLDDISDRLQPDSAAQKLSAELTAKLKTDEEKASAIIRYVQEKLVYQAIEFGTRARMPEKAARIIANRYGDCKDHSLLAYQLLKAAGIPANLVLVNTAAPVIDRFPDLDQFNHVVIASPAIRGGTIWDATSKFSSTRDIAPLYLADRHVLYIDPTTTGLTKIPTDEKQSHLVSSKRKVTPHFAEGHFTVNETLILAGHYAAGFRSYLTRSNEAQRKANLQQLLGSRIRLTLDELEIENLQDFDQPLRLILEYKVSGTIQKRGNKIEAPIPAIFENFYCEINRSGRRRSPFAISSPMVMQSEVTLQLPENFKTTAPVWTNDSQKKDTVTHTLSVKNNSMTAETRLIRGTYPKEKFATYADALTKAARNISGDLRGELPE